MQGHCFCSLNLLSFGVRRCRRRRLCESSLLSSDDGDAFLIISTCTKTASYPGTKLVGVMFGLRKRMKNSPSFARVLHKTLNLVSSRCCFCRGWQINVPKFERHVQWLFFLIKTIVLRRCRCLSFQIPIYKGALPRDLTHDYCCSFLDSMTLFH